MTQDTQPRFVTTLEKIRDHSPCRDGWEKLLKNLGKTKADNEEISLLTILDSNGLDDALWCLQAIDGCDREIRLFAVWCARQVQHLMTDQRSVAALDVAEKFANGEATTEELAAAQDAAWDAAWAAARDAERDAARDAARAAAWAAARGAVRSAVRAAVRGAAWDAAWAAAWAAAWVAAREAAQAAQESKLREIIAQGI